MTYGRHYSVKAKCRFRFINCTFRIRYVGADPNTSAPTHSLKREPENGTLAAKSLTGSGMDRETPEGTLGVIAK
jgi:hypothetical protein